MDLAETEKEKAVQSQVSWLPATPLKLILPRSAPISPPGEDTQLNQYNVDAHYGVLSPSSSLNNVKGAFEVETSFDNNAFGFCGQPSMDMDMCKNMRFADLLALADAASPIVPWANSNVEDSLVSPSKSLLFESNYTTADTLFTDPNPTPELNPCNDCYYIPQEPNGTTLHSNVILSLAPITPDKTLEVGCRQASEVQMCSNENKEQEWHKSTSAVLHDEHIPCNQELIHTHSPTCLSSDALTTQFEENHSHNKGDNHAIDMNKTSSKKPRRKKHRPKVIVEGKPKRTPKPATPKPKECLNGKRKYVRKKGFEGPTNSTEGVLKESIDSVSFEPAKKSCKRSLKFEIEQSRGESSTCKSFVNLLNELQEEAFHGTRFRSTAHLNEESKTVLRDRHVDLACNLTSSENQMLGDYVSFPEPQVSFKPLPSSPKSKNEGRVQGFACDVQREAAEIIFKAETRLTRSNAPCSDNIILNAGKQMDSSKGKHSTATEHANTRSMNLMGANFNGLHAYQTTCSQHLPNIQYKRKRANGQTSRASTTSTSTSTMKQMKQATSPQIDAKGCTSELKSGCCISCYDSNLTSYSFTINDVEKDPEKINESLDSILVLSQTERSTERRSRAAARLHNLDSPSNTGGTMQQNSTNKQQEIPHQQRKKQIRKKQSSTHELQLHSNLMSSSHNLFSGKYLDAPIEVVQKQMLTVDALTKQLEHLNINRESCSFAYPEQHAIVPYKVQKPEHNALALYKKDGTVVPFDPIRRRHPRPKVDLDEETDRVWKLLMDSIDSQGIDGTDEDTAKKWAEERSVFHGRVDSFIARMHLVQGDRRFSKWKGSVLDSVIGVFLTQNVSDHLSSSAFMSLAAHFPLKLSSNHEEHNEERSNLPELLILDKEVNNIWDKEVLNQSSFDQNSIMTHDIEASEDVINENNSSVTSTGFVTLADESKSRMLETTEISTGELHSIAIRRDANIRETEKEKALYLGVREVINDACSCQNSGDSSVDPNVQKIGPCSDSNSGAEDLSRTAKHNILDKTTFVKIFEATNLSILSQRSMSSDENSSYVCNQSTLKEFHDQSKNKGNSNSIQSSTGISFISSSNYSLNLTQNSEVLEAQCTEPCKILMQSSDLLQKKNEFQTNNINTLKVESANQAMGIAYSSILSRDPEVAELLKKNTQHDFLTSSEETPNLMQAESGSCVDSSTSRNNISEISMATTLSKSKKLGKGKGDNVDWDSLRKQVIADGRRDRDESTMDTLDWEAVRCADVDEIAHVIRQRGMNNRIAERIKDFLNRLVKEHGSIDLEWLRDVPPDKAKEYLLSIRGLGLKSVECVRLLTLHHLAFPVDTNVGRIAVRLGWVPLQPLPESLQLHLLELYPVLESIQKYLWPRLCKLDQQTLYELHYQMITFGKVFCTKSKPNCNACPLRAECRHFASAFASARLALPAPEQRAIVTKAESQPTDPTPAVTNGQLSLLLPPPTGQRDVNQQTEACRQLDGQSGNSNCLPIVEEPTTPEPEHKDILEDIEDTFSEDPDEIPTIKLNIQELTLNLKKYMQQNMELQEGEVSKALVALTPDVASIPMPKLKNLSQLRTEHSVYELPDSHPLLAGLDKREPDDPGKYLLAIWTPGETANSIQPPERKCSSQESGQLCNDKECLSCNSIRESNSQIVRGTLLIPCRTAMRGSFPLNGTYFQVNEVFADHNSSINPINVPRSWIWNLERRVVYFGTSVPTIFKGLSTKEIQECFWKGYVCVRGFDQKTRAPRPLMARLHFPVSKLLKNKGKRDNS